MAEFSGSFNGSGPFTRVFTETTCSFFITFTGSIDLDVTVNQDGTVTGTGQLSGTFDSIATGGSTSTFECFDDFNIAFSDSGSVSGTTASVRYSGAGGFVTGNFQGSLDRAAGTITGTASFGLNASGISGSGSASVTLQGDPVVVDEPDDAVLTPPDGFTFDAAGNNLTSLVTTIQDNGFVQAASALTADAFKNLITDSLKTFGAVLANGLGLLNSYKALLASLSVSDMITNLATNVLNYLGSAPDCLTFGACDQRDTLYRKILTDFTADYTKAVEAAGGSSSPLGGILSKIGIAAGISNNSAGETEFELSVFNFAAAPIVAEDRPGGISMVIAGNSGGTVEGGSGDDQLSGGLGADEINAGNGNNTLLAGAGNDTMTAGNGNDFLDGGTGADTMAAGDGNDTYVVDNAGDLVLELIGFGTDTIQSSISFTLPDNVENLTLTGSEDLVAVGNELDNSVIGNSGNNTLTGNAGDDILEGGAGADFLDGGSGNNTGSYAHSAAAVSVDLSTGIGLFGDAQGDTFSNIINLIGSPGGDSLLGTGLGNAIASGAGNDLLRGFGGDDSLDGGLGLDVAQYAGARSNITVTSNAGGGYTVNATSSGEGTDQLVDIERLQLSDGVIALDTSGNAGQTYRLYQAAFDRTPDTPGLSHNVGVMDNGVSLKGLSNAFLVSAEFTAQFGADPSNETYLTALYANVLNRAPDPAGFNAWNDLLTSGTLDRADVLVGFSESPENISLVGTAIENGIWLG